MNSDGFPSRPVAPPPPPPSDESLPEGRGFQVGNRRAAVELGLAAGGVALVVVLVFALAGRLAAWALPLVPLDVDRRLGQLGSGQGELGTTPCGGTAAKYVEELGDRLVRAIDGPPFEFQFRLVQSEEVNAYALPGGYVTVNTGLLSAAESGEEVAAVLAHEIQHVLRRHGTARMLRSMGSRLVIGTLFGGTDLDGVAGLTSQLSSLAYGRAEEAEADRLGVRLLQQASIDPGGLRSFFSRLEQEGGPRLPELLSSHPDPGDRGSVESSGMPGRFEPLRPLPPIRCGVSGEF